jgi:hypothetical protein
VAQAGSEEQIATVHGILNDTRRKIYRVLAEDAPDEATGDGA